MYIRPHPFAHSIDTVLRLYHRQRLALYGALVNVRSDESDRKGKGRKKRKTAHQPEEQEKEDATASPLSQISETPSVGAPESTPARGGFPAVDWGQHSPK